MDKRFEQMDKRFEQMQQSMDKRFEQMDKRFEQVDKRFEQMDKRFEQVDQNFVDLKNILKNIQQQIGKPFEQFARNVVVRILHAEGKADVELLHGILDDPDGFSGNQQVKIEIDGYSEKHAVVVEITSVLRDIDKVDKLLAKKKFLEKKFNKPFRGFLVAATSELTTQEKENLLIKLYQNHCEMLNL